MRVVIPLVIFGALAFISGIIFYFQGNGLVGPEESFMYANPDWIEHGKLIAIFGIVMCASVGIGAFIAKKRIK